MIEAKNVDQALKKDSKFFHIAALTAGSDVADIPLMRVSKAMEIVAINIIPQGDDAGIDASNTSAWLFEVGSTTLASKTFNDTVAFPDKGEVEAITLSTTVADLKRAEDDVITYSVTNGTTAATPATVIEVEYVIADESIFDTVHRTNYAS